jgi:hypothetical protein
MGFTAEANVPADLLDREPLAALPALLGLEPALPRFLQRLPNILQIRSFLIGRQIGKIENTSKNKCRVRLTMRLVVN